MNSDPMIAAVDIVGLLIFAIIVAVSAFLKKKEAEQEEKQARPAPKRPEPDLDLEDGANDWQRQESVPAPPPLPQTARRAPIPKSWDDEEERFTPIKQEIKHHIDRKLRESALLDTEKPLPVSRPRPLVKPPVAQTRSGPRHSRDGAQAVALIQNRQTVRQAFIASQVFGPPKALEQSQL